MAVKINLELDAGDVAKDITAVKTALESLNDTSNEVDLGDSIDADGITGAIGEIVSKLEQLEVDSDSIAQNISDSFSEIPDEIKVEHDHQTPDGSTGSGDSTGGDPQIHTGGFLDAQKKMADAASVTDGGDRANFLERSYGEHTLMGEDFMGDWLHKPKAGRTGLEGPIPEGGDKRILRRQASLGANAADFNEDGPTVGLRNGFGMEPESMDHKRKEMDLPTVLDNRKTLDERMSELTDVQIGDRDLSSSIQEYINALDEKAKVAAERAEEYEFQFLNGDLFESELSGSEQQDAFRQADEREGMPDFEQIGQQFESEFARTIHDSGLFTDSLENLEEQQKELLENAGLDPQAVSDSLNPDKEVDGDVTKGRSRETFRELNRNIRENELGSPDEWGAREVINESIPETNAEISAASGFQDHDPIRFGDSTGGTVGDTEIGKRLNNITSLDDAFEGLNDAQSSLGQKLRKLKPTMGKYMQVFAALIPVAIGLGVQLAGVAASMGAVAAAGGAIMGLGLLGHGESMAGSFAKAKQQMKGLKREMFQTFQPAMQQFAPIQSRAFDAIPDVLGRDGGVADKIEGLAKYEDTLFQLGGSLAGGMERAVEIVVQNEKAISDLTTTFAGLIGSGLLKFFEWLIQTASENKKLMKDLGKSLISLAIVAYNLAMMISRIVASLKPFIKAIAWLSTMLNNKLVVGLLTAITVGALLAVTFAKIGLAVWGLTNAIGSLIAFLGILGGGSVLAGITTFFGTMLSYISATIIALYEMYGAAVAAATALAATGVGALIVGGGLLAGATAMKGMGPSPPSGGAGRGGGGTTIYNDNSETTIVQSGNDYASQKATEETIAKVNETNRAQKTPAVNSTAASSDGKPNGTN